MRDRALLVRLTARRRNAAREREPRGASLRLTLLQGLTLREAARQLGVSRSTVHRAQQQGLTLLRQRMGA